MRELKFVNILGVDDELKEKVRQWRNKEEIRKFMLTQHIITEEEHCKWIENLTHKNDGRFWVVFVETTPIGSVYLQNINYEKLTSEWGFYIGEDAYRGGGLGKMVLFKLLEMFFDEMNFESLVTKVLSNNIVALSIYKKFKFRQIDDRSQNHKTIVLLEFSKEDWMQWKETLRDECFYRNSK